MKLIHESTRIRGALLFLCLFLFGCSSRQEKDPSQLTHKEPKLPLLQKPDIIETNRFLGTLPSGRLYDLRAAGIAIVAAPDYREGADPRTYLNEVVRREKSRGTSYLPCHFYITPAGQVLQGQSEQRCGYIEGEVARDSFLVSVLGDYDNPTQFLPEAQQTALIQTCAWLCHQYSLDPRKIVPATEVNPNAAPLGQNLAIWFGPTQTLQTRVESTLAQGYTEKKEKGLKHPFYKGVNKQDEIPSGF